LPAAGLVAVYNSYLQFTGDSGTSF
jgi:hypothetical protein